MSRKRVLNDEDRNASDPGRLYTQHRHLNRYMGSLNSRSDIDLSQVTRFQLDEGWAYDDPHDIMEPGERNEFEQQRPHDEKALEQFANEFMANVQRVRPMGRVVWSIQEDGEGEGKGDERQATASKHITEQESVHARMNPRQAIPPKDKTQSFFTTVLQSPIYQSCERLPFVHRMVPLEEEMPVPTANAQRYELVTDIVLLVLDRIPKMERLRVDPQSSAVVALPTDEQVLLFRYLGDQSSRFQFVLWLKQAVGQPTPTDLAMPAPAALAENGVPSEADWLIVPQLDHYWYVARRHYIPFSWQVQVVL